MTTATLRNGKYVNQVSAGNWRVYLLALLIFLGGSVIILRLYFLQVVGHQTYKAIAEDQHGFFQKLVPVRGQIYFNNGNDRYPLAINQELQMVYAVPKEIEDREGTTKNLAEILQLDEGMLREKLSNPEDVYEVLKHKLNPEEVSRIKEKNLKGIYLTPETFRYYPAGELASHVVGFVGSNGTETAGRYGLEAFWEETLKGTAGSLRQEKDSRGRWISIADREVTEARNGDTLVLSLNYTVQYEVEKILQEAIDNTKAEGGTAIVMNPNTGKILALANRPGFNPNEFNKVEDPSVFLDSAVAGTYECGSVFKTITAAIGIDDGKISPSTTYVDTGEVREAGYTIKNSDLKAYGLQTMTQMLETSLNTGAIFVEKLVGNKQFADYVRRFGFGEKSGIELPGELAGNIKNLDILRSDINFFTASFGQGITVTPIQLINAYAVIANGGKLMQPQVVDKIIHSDGTEEEVAPKEIRQVISQETARQVSQMLRSVVTNGHGKRADVPGYLVGGKTGTAQVASSGAKGYEEGLAIGSFAGFAPLDNPQFVILVKVVNPKGVQWAESTAAPAFGKIMKFVLEYYRVEPTEEIDVTKLNKLEKAAAVINPPTATETKDKDKN